MPDGGEVVDFTRKTITRWVATDAYGKEFEGRKTLEVGREILTLGDACTHCFNPDSSSRSDLLKKIDELVRKLGLKSRAEYFLIRGSLNYFYARLYVSRHKKPMPLLIMGVTAHEFLAGKTGPITTTLFDFPGQVLHPEADMRGGNLLCTPSHLVEMDTSLSTFMSHILDLPEDSPITNFHHTYGNSGEMTPDQQMQYMVSRHEMTIKLSKMNPDSAELVRILMENNPDIFETKEDAAELLSVFLTEGHKNKYLGCLEGYKNGLVP